VTVWLLASRAVTVKLTAVPAVADEGAETVKCVADGFVPPVTACASLLPDASYVYLITVPSSYVAWVMRFRLSYVYSALVDAKVGVAIERQTRAANRKITFARSMTVSLMLNAVKNQNQRIRATTLGEKSDLCPLG
jgi:hypothetical protein